MKVELKALRSLEIEDSLINYWPDDPLNFGSWIRAMIGPDNQDGAESFDILICTPLWLQKELSTNKVLSGKGVLILSEYDYDEIVNFLEKQIATCHSENWSDVALRLSRIGFWEYEDYQP
ncbi:immunity 8 family protein [Dickeya ananatis]|uniref:immunity 8 family protein n=1 Tax=Dickeya ananatis TaxID=3061286 RepID=UPI00388E610B